MRRMTGEGIIAVAVALALVIVGGMALAGGCATARNVGNPKVGTIAVDKVKVEKTTGVKTGHVKTGDVAAFNPHDIANVKTDGGEATGVKTGSGDASALKHVGDLVLEIQGGRIGLTIVASILAIGMTIVLVVQARLIDNLIRDLMLKKLDE